MVEVTADQAHNLLSLSYSGRVEAEEVRRNEARVRLALAELQPGFRLLTDLSGLEYMDPASAVSIRKMMDLCNQKGIAMVVRVIPDPNKDIGFSILSLFHYDKDVQIITCASLEEALKAIAAR